MVHLAYHFICCKLQLHSPCVIFIGESPVIIPLVLLWNRAPKFRNFVNSNLQFHQQMYFVQHLQHLFIPFSHGGSDRRSFCSDSGVCAEIP